MSENKEKVGFANGELNLVVKSNSPYQYTTGVRNVNLGYSSSAVSHHPFVSQPVAYISFELLKGLKEDKACARVWKTPSADSVPLFTNAPDLRLPEDTTVVGKIIESYPMLSVSEARHITRMVLKSVRRVNNIKGEDE